MDDSTDITDGGTVTDYADNPSNGIDVGSLMSQLIGTAGSAYEANQAAQANEAYAAAQAQSAAILATPANPLSIFLPNGKPSWLLIGAGVLALALILRR